MAQLLSDEDSISNILELPVQTADIRAKVSMFYSSTSPHKSNVSPNKTQQYFFMSFRSRQHFG